MLALGFFYLLQANFFKIQGISVSGVKVINEADIRSEVEKILTETYFGVSKNNILIYPKHKIREKIAESFSVAKSVSLEIDNKELLITITEKKPEALWCREKCFFVDDTGVLYKESPLLEGDVFISFYEKSTSPLTIGTKIIDHAVLSSVIEAVRILQKEKFSVWKVLVVNNDEFYLEDSSGMDIIINPLEDVVSQIERVLRAFASKELTTKSFSSLEYIDARFGAKLFLKEKELSTPK
jgi:cell division septal protein FtsQ